MVNSSADKADRDSPWLGRENPQHLADLTDNSHSHNEKPWGKWIPNAYPVSAASIPCRRIYIEYDSVGNKRRGDRDLYILHYSISLLGAWDDACVNGKAYGNKLS